MSQRKKSKKKKTEAGADLHAKVAEHQANVTQLLRETGRPGIDSLIEWLETGTDYFDAPASSRLDYHGCHPYGLVEHSINVYTVFLQKVMQYGLEVGDDEVVIASLMHDLCKVNQYRPNRLKSGNISGPKPYVIEDDLPIGHGEKSLYLVAQHIDLTDTEAMLIRWHMGPFADGWENYENKVGEACPAIYAFHNADQEASKYMDK